jgi:hypothetical protein
MLSAVRAQIKRQLLRRLCYDASVRFNPEELDLAAGEIQRDVEWIRVQPDVDLKVYWKILAIGKGPAFSLYAFGSRFSSSIVSVREMAISIFFWAGLRRPMKREFGCWSQARPHKWSV